MNQKYNRYYTFIRPILKNSGVQTYSTIVFSLVSATIFLLFAIKPTITTILSLQKSIDEQKNVLSSLDKNAHDLTLGKQNLDAIPPSTIDKLNNLLPDKTELTNLADDLSNLAALNQASISAMQFQPTDLIGEPSKLNPNPTLVQISFTFNLQGSYQKAITILNSLSKFNRLISIQTVNLGQSSEGTFATSISATAYFLQN